MILLLLGACLPPTAQATVFDAFWTQARVQLAADQQNTTPQPQTERFPSRVTTTLLEHPAPETVATAEKALQELREQNTPLSDTRPAGDGASGSAGVSGSSTSQPGFHVLSFSAAGGSQQIHIPASGSFRLTVQEGEQFSILDSDARDGAAQVQLPAGHYDTLLKLSNGGTLQLEDRLYHVKDTLQGNAWQRLGLRPLPVPAAWYEPDGQFVLRFTTSQVQVFQLSWQQHNTPAEPPPGLAEIGPAGGTLVLPGVATLEIPAGALSQPTVVRLRQQMAAASQRVYCPNPYIPDECYDGWVFAAPIVRIDPLELDLSQPAKLDLPIYAFFEKYPPVSIEHRGISDPFASFGWSYAPYFSRRQDIQSLSDIKSHDLPMWVKRFSYITKHINYYPSMDEFVLPFQMPSCQQA